MSDNQRKTLVPLSPFPAFEVSDLQGNMLDEKNLKKGKLLFSFYRYSECLFCNLRIHDLLKRLPDYEAKGLQVVIVFQSPEDDIRRSMQKHEVPFSIISDPKRELYRKFHLNEHSPWGYFRACLRLVRVLRARLKGYPIERGYGSATLLPADFLVRDGVIEDAFYAKDISEHIPFSRIEAFLNKA